MHTKQICPYFVGLCENILHSMTPLHHTHLDQEIRYCNTCWWKMILRKEKEIVYENEPCKYQKSKHANAFVNICKKTSTIISDMMCLILDKKPVKHLYLYPHEKVKDYDPFYACPMKEQANSIPTIHNTPFANMHKM